VPRRELGAAYGVGTFLRGKVDRGALKNASAQPHSGLVFNEELEAKATRYLYDLLLKKKKGGGRRGEERNLEITLNIKQKKSTWDGERLPLIRRGSDPAGASKKERRLRTYERY